MGSLKKTAINASSKFRHSLTKKGRRSSRVMSVSIEDVHDAEDDNYVRSDSVPRGALSFPFLSLFHSAEESTNFALKAVLGEGATIVLDGQKVLPVKAKELGFSFRYPYVKDALRAIMSSKKQGDDIQARNWTITKVPGIKVAGISAPVSVLDFCSITMSLVVGNECGLRITIPDVIENEWFEKGYKPPSFDTADVTSLDDVDSVFNEYFVIGVHVVDRQYLQ